MEIKTTYSIEGLQELTQALEELPIKVQAQILKSVIRRAGKKYIVDPLKTKIPWESQKKYIEIITKPNEPLSIYAGVSRGGYKLRFIDKGTKMRTKGHNRGQIIGKNIIEPTIESQIDPIIKYFDDEMGNEINDVLLRRLKKLYK